MYQKLDRKLVDLTQDEIMLVSGGTAAEDENDPNNPDGNQSGGGGPGPAFGTTAGTYVSISHFVATHTSTSGGTFTYNSGNGTTVSASTNWNNGNTSILGSYTTGSGFVISASLSGNLCSGNLTSGNVGISIPIGGGGGHHP